MCRMVEISKNIRMFFVSDPFRPCYDADFHILYPLFILIDTLPPSVERRYGIFPMESAPI